MQPSALLHYISLHYARSIIDAETILIKVTGRTIAHIGEVVSFQSFLKVVCRDMILRSYTHRAHEAHEAYDEYLAHVAPKVIHDLERTQCTALE